MQSLLRCSLSAKVRSLRESEDGETSSGKRGDGVAARERVAMFTQAVEK
jgi:hypothetical protein